MVPSKAAIQACAPNAGATVSVVDFAVSQLNEVRDVTLLARALGWSAWVHACAGQTSIEEIMRITKGVSI